MSANRERETWKVTSSRYISLTSVQQDKESPLGLDLTECMKKKNLWPEEEKEKEGV